MVGSGGRAVKSILPKPAKHLMSLTPDSCGPVVDSNINLFSPLPGEMIQLDLLTNIFQMG